MVESKENVPTTRPMTTREKFNAMKRRVALPSDVVVSIFVSQNFGGICMLNRFEMFQHTFLL